MLTIRRNHNDPIFDTFFKMFDDSLTRNSKNAEVGDNYSFYNVSSFVDSNNNLVTTIPIPGVKPDDVTVTRDDKFIYIEYKLLNRSSNQEQKYSKSYKFTAARDYDISTLNANVENGMLELTLKPKSKNIENQRIEVKVNQK
jgi:HSP20 family molecular chaperone IbpA